MSVIPDYTNEIELWGVEREFRARLTTMHISLTSKEVVRPIQIQLSPISFLPNEILIHAFHHGLTEAPDSAHSLPLPIAAAGVCKSWRAAVLRAPELWTRVFVTSVTPSDHLHTYLERSGNLELDVNFCHWPESKRNEKEAFLESIVGALHRHAHRLRSLSLWDLSDTAVCTVMKGMLTLDTPRMTSVSLKAKHTAYDHYYRLRDLYLLQFLGGSAPSLTHLEIDHFPIETFRRRSEWPFNALHNLTSLTLRTKECPTAGFCLPPYLIEFPALCALLRLTPNLVTLALYGPIIEPDEDFPVRPPAVTLSLLETLIIYRHEPGTRYHCELLSVLTLPTLKRLEIPWHDDLTVEDPRSNRAARYLFNEEGTPRFGTVKELYLHDSTIKTMMPTRTFMKAFPNVEEVILGGADVVNFAATLRGFVLSNPTSPPRARCHGPGDLNSQGMLIEGAWQTVRKMC
ncbi:hypothetical protein JVU11DRAFT_3775 [Chiua virens]|nr:hypothetical protein JVU11DRAFT_3775 [Chiua virens]